MTRGMKQDKTSGFLYFANPTDNKLNKSEQNIIDGYKFSLPLPTRIEPIVPKEVAFTTQSQPTIYYYMNNGWDGYTILTITEQKSVKPILETYIISGDKKGIYSISAADYNVSLKEGIEYEWSLSFISDMSERSLDMIISSAIIYKQNNTSILKKRYWLDLYNQSKQNSDIKCQINLLSKASLMATIEYLTNK